MALDLLAAIPGTSAWYAQRRRGVPGVKDVGIGATYKPRDPFKDKPFERNDEKLAFIGALEDAGIPSRAVLGEHPKQQDFNDLLAALSGLKMPRRQTSLVPGVFPGTRFHNREFLR
jgi:hypothetical protein